MANRTVQLNSLTPGTSFMIRGKLAFSRITSQIAGEELARRVENMRRNGMIPVERPHTTVSLTNASVVYSHVDANTGNPIQKLPEEIYAEESLYMATKNKENGYCYTAYNKGNYLPSVGVMSADGHTVNQIVPENELAKGLDVTLVIRVFKPKTQRNNGTSLEGVIVNEPIRYYDGNAMAGALNAHGITWNQNAAAASRIAAPPAQGVPNADAAPFDNPAPQPVAPPQGNPYSVQQPASQPAANPYAAAAQQAQQNQPAFETFEPSAQAAPAPAPAPQPAAASNQPQPDQNPGAIRYTGEDRRY